MYLKSEILNSIQEELIFHSMDEIISISDCERMNSRPQKQLPEDKLYWIDYKSITENDIVNQKAILLIDKDQFQSLKKERIKNCKIIAATDPKLIFLTLCSYFHNDEIIREIHPGSYIHPNAKIGLHVYVGPHTFIDECTIGDNCIIHECCSIAKGVEIGENTEIHCGTRIGLSAFGFEKNPEGVWVKYPQIGSVKIGKNVSIGANTCISNGFINDTIIDDGVVIDNLCQIGSSAKISAKTKIAANSSISNNTIIGERCWISPGVSIKENLVLCDDVFVGIGSVVIRSIAKPCTVFGIPAAQI